MVSKYLEHKDASSKHLLMIAERIIRRPDKAYLYSISYHTKINSSDVCKALQKMLKKKWVSSNTKKNKKYYVIEKKFFIDLERHVLFWKNKYELNTRKQKELLKSYKGVKNG